MHRSLPTPPTQTAVDARPRLFKLCISGFLAQTGLTLEPP